MLKDATKTAPTVIKQFEELRTKYKFMQMNLIERKRRLKIQIPDIKASLDAIKVLEKSKVLYRFKQFDFISRLIINELVCLLIRIENLISLSLSLVYSKQEKILKQSICSKIKCMCRRSYRRVNRIPSFYVWVRT